MKKNLTLFVMLLCAFTMVSAENWPGWRGPRNDGTSNAVNLPTKWSKTENVAWRLPLPGSAPATPVIWGEHIFLNSTEGDDLILVAANTSGKILWKKQVDTGNKKIREDESNPAAPSPSTDGKHVWTFFGTGKLACFDFDGNQVWSADLESRYGKFSMYWGMSTTPLLDGDRLYIQLMHDNAQLVLALDKLTGREIWRHQRKTDAKMECLHSYASPFVYRYKNTEQLLTHGSDYITAHDLKDGSEIWRCGGLQKAEYNPYYRFVASPVAADGLVVAPSAKNGPVLGLKPEGASGDITDNKTQYAWKRSDNTPDVPSPLIHDGLVYLCRENGVLICMDAKTGEQVYMERGHNRRHRASPVYADGKIFLTAMDGTITVVKAGRSFEVLATNSIDETMTASPAIAGDTIYLRGYESLYAIRK